MFVEYVVLRYIWYWTCLLSTSCCVTSGIGRVCGVRRVALHLVLDVFVEYVVLRYIWYWTCLWSTSCCVTSGIGRVC